MVTGRTGWNAQREPSRVRAGEAAGGFVRSLLLLAVLVMVQCAAVAAPSFRAELDSDSIGVGDTTTLKLIFTDLGEVQPPALPELPNCPTQYVGAGSQISIVNFDRSSSIIHQYVLQPKSAGVVEIPALAVDIGGQRYTSNPLKLRVGQGYDQSQIGFLKLVVPKTDFYVGETVPVEIRFYFRTPPHRQGTPQLKMDGFTKGKDNADNLPPETINGEVYSVYRRAIAITAVKAGELELGPAEFQTIYLFRSSRRQSIFDDPFFGGGQQKQINFTAEAVKIRVLPPPAVNQPAGFSGAVGRFSLDPVIASPTNVAAGDPITVKLTVRGRGNFAGLKLPDFPAGAGFQSYAGTNAFEETDVLGIEGVKTFEQVVVPEQAGAQMLRLPPFVAWNPEAKRYDVLTVRAIPINVRAGAAAQAQPLGNVPTAASTEPSAPRAATTPETVPLKTRLGPMFALTPALVERPWFLALMLAAPLLYAGLGIGQRLRQRARERGPDVRGQRERAVAGALTQLDAHAASGRAAEFFAALNQALQEQLALTLGGSSGAYTEDVVAGRLEPRGLSAEDASRIRGLFEAVAQARYSSTASQAELAKLAESARAAVTALRKLEGQR